MRPLYDALADRAAQGKRRFHMPGHKGKDVLQSPLAGASALDFTELYGTGNLYDGAYPIADAEKLAARAWGAPHAYFLTGGTTQGIYAALRLLLPPGGQVLMDRGCHKSVYRALALLDGRPTYLYPGCLEPFHAAAPVTAEAVDAALCAHPEISCVILTCPTYYGVVCDIKAISRAAHGRGARLLVDQAHGAHFPFTPSMAGAVALGADLAVCSLHKTLPALGQAALLTTGEGFEPAQVRDATSLFGTSSPSYAVMASMDLTRAFMEESGRARCARLAERLAALRARVEDRGVFRALAPEGGDPLRLCVYTAGAGLGGYQAARILEEELDVVCEMADALNVLFIVTPADDEADLQALEEALAALEERGGGAPLPGLGELPAAQMRATPRQALFAPYREIPLAHASGACAARNLCPYPPGIPAVAAGEVIRDAHLEYLYLSGFSPEDRAPVLDL